MRRYLVPLLLLCMLGVNLTKNYLDGGELSVSNFTDEGKTLRWGLVKRTDNKPPDVDTGAPELLKKYSAFYMGDQSKNFIYLTFDEGYENGQTPKILDTLKQNGVKAVFFITGHFLKDNEALIGRMIAEGHTVGNHTMTHKSMPEISDSAIKKDIMDLETAFFGLTGQHMQLLRPPKGEYSERSLRVSKEHGYVTVFWSFAYEDWEQNKIRGGDYAYQAVMKYLHKGAILLLHAVSPDNAEALDRIIKDARLKGYEFGDLNDLVGLRRTP